MEIFREFRFEAAHFLRHVPEGHKCHRLHGHSYRLLVFVEGKVNPETGWVMDFADLKKAVAPTVDELDHHFLNEVEGLGISTAENVARWIWRRIKPALPGLSKVELWETATAGCVYRGEVP